MLGISVVTPQCLTVGKARLATNHTAVTAYAFLSLLTSSGTAAAAAEEEDEEEKTRLKA